MQSLWRLGVGHYLNYACGCPDVYGTQLTENADSGNTDSPVELGDSEGDTYDEQVGTYICDCRDGFAPIEGADPEDR